MKYSILIGFFLSINFGITISLFSQDNSLIMCEYTPTDDLMGQSTDDFVCGNGIHITSKETLRVMVVFAKFPDDVSQQTFWPNDGFPDFANSFIDSTENLNSTHFLNVTNFFREMSLT